MPEHHETRWGLYAGLFAAIMVIALAVMAVVALEPPMQMAESSFSIPEPTHEAPRPDQPG